MQPLDREGEGSKSLSSHQEKACFARPREESWPPPACCFYSSGPPGTLAPSIARPGKIGLNVPKAESSCPSSTKSLRAATIPTISTPRGLPALLSSLRCSKPGSRHHCQQDAPLPLGSKLPGSGLPRLPGLQPGGARLNP